VERKTVFSLNPAAVVMIETNSEEPRQQSSLYLFDWQYVYGGRDVVHALTRPLTFDRALSSGLIICFEVLHSRRDGSEIDRLGNGTYLII